MHTHVLCLSLGGSAEEMNEKETQITRKSKLLCRGKPRLPHHRPFSSLAPLCSPGTTKAFPGLLAQWHRVLLHIWALQGSHGTCPGCSHSSRNRGHRSSSAAPLKYLL